MRAETKEILEKLKAKLLDCKYVILVLLVGLVLLMLPTSAKKDAPEDEPPSGESSDTATYDAERRLEEILSLIDGAGQVRVMLTLKSDGERVLARESETSADERDGERSEKSSDSALVVQKGSGQSGEVEVKYLYPEYRGAVVAAQGAGSAAVRQELTEAVKAATGLGAADIKIVKMK